MNILETKVTRKRAANFTKTEVTALMYLIKKYENQIHPKLVGANSNKMKEQTWAKIADEFNALPGTQGNPRSANILKNKYTNIKKLIKRERLEKEETHKNTESAPIDPESTGVHFENDDDDMDFKEETSEDVCSSPNVNESQSIEDLEELKKRCFLAEHALKLQHMQEKHDKALNIQEEEAEEKLRQMREEHRVQMEILQLRKQCLLK